MNAQFRNVQESIRICLLDLLHFVVWLSNMVFKYESVRRMNTECKKAVRRTVNLPRTTKGGLRPLVAGGDSFQCQHERRCAVMYNEMLYNENVLVSHVAKRTLYNANGVLG